VQLLETTAASFVVVIAVSVVSRLKYSIIWKRFPSLEVVEEVDIENIVTVDIDSDAPNEFDMAWREVLTLRTARFRCRTQREAVKLTEGLTALL
jgi:hypothetical protein